MLLSAYDFFTKGYVVVSVPPSVTPNYCQDIKSMEFSEKIMQSLIRDYPDFFFCNDIVLYQKEFWIGTGSRVDFIFVDQSNNMHVLVEAQIGKINKEHADKLYKRYLPNYRKMRPDVKARGILIANAVSSEMLELNESRGVEVQCYSVEELLGIDKKYSEIDKKRDKYTLYERFVGFESSDFQDIIKANDEMNPELRINAIGKLYQIKDYIVNRIDELFPNSFLETKLSDRTHSNRLDVPWMAFYFGARAEGSTQIPHINITLSEVNETGSNRLSECSVHLNAELKKSFSLVLNALKNSEDFKKRIEESRNLGLEIRLYSKIPITPQNTNNNFWLLRKKWKIDKYFDCLDVVKWFEGFEGRNEQELISEINRYKEIYGNSEKVYAEKILEKGSSLSAIGRSVFRVGKWWEADEVIQQKESFKISVFDTIKDLTLFLNYFKNP